MIHRVPRIVAPSVIPRGAFVGGGGVRAPAGGGRPDGDPQPQGTETILVDYADEQEALFGLGATSDDESVWVGVNGADHAYWAANQDTVFQKAFDIGIVEMRLPNMGGATENEVGVDLWQDFYDAYVGSGSATGPDYDFWRANRYLSKAGAYHWSRIDFIVDYILDPMKAFWAARGKYLRVIGIYQCFNQYSGTYPGSTPLHISDVDAYGDMILAWWQHLDSTYGWVPEVFEPILEPDNNAQISGTLVGQWIVDAMGKLQGAGYDPVIYAPSETSWSTGYFDDMMAVTGMSAYTDQLYLSYHRYGTPNFTEINARIATHSLPGAVMSEWNGADFTTVETDFRNAPIAQWTKIGMGGPNPSGNSWIHFNPTDGIGYNDDADAARVGQWFKYLETGGVRLGVSSTKSDHRPYVWKLADGSIVAVIWSVPNTGNTEFQLGPLAAGTYEIAYAQGTTGNPEVIVGTQNVAQNGSVVYTPPASATVTVRKV